MAARRTTVPDDTRRGLIDAWAAKQDPPVTRPEAIRGMIDAMLHILAKQPGEKPTKKAKGK